MDHPKNYQELVKQLATQEACLDYIAALRWSDGFVCPECGCPQFWKSQRLQWIGAKCRRQTRVLAGTLFQDTKLPLTLWFQMIWWFVGPKNGASGAFTHAKLWHRQLSNLLEASGEIALLYRLAPASCIEVTSLRSMKPSWVGLTTRLSLSLLLKNVAKPQAGFVCNTSRVVKGRKFSISSPRPSYLAVQSSLTGIKVMPRLFKRAPFTGHRKNRTLGRRWTATMSGCSREFTEPSRY